MKHELIIVMALLALVGCSDETSQARGQFLSGCVQGGAPKSICVCIFDALEEKYSPAELKTMNRSDGGVPERLVEDVIRSAQACRHE